MRFTENFIETEINVTLDNGQNVCLQKNVDGWYILSSETILMQVWYLLSRYDGQMAFVDVYCSKNDENCDLPIFELEYYGEILQGLDIDDDEETLQYNLEIIVECIQENFEN